MWYPKADEIMAIHERILEASGGLNGIREMGLLFSIAERPKTSLMGNEMFPDVFTKAAAYLEALTVYHVFADGNKRTALAVTAVFLEANGYSFNPSEDATVRFMIAVAKKRKGLKEIVVWIKRQTR